ncbi:MAG: PepSY domain-containing protein [Neisseriaceae bacterium]|nr:PepSY domain-containing protein [Neisseriaceae bacterium]MBQ9725114.1 PepSY domain-containing protein [Neisseriaceae bacterium]
MKHLTTALILALSFSAAYAERHDIWKPDTQPYHDTRQDARHDDRPYRQNDHHFEQHHQRYISHQKAAEIALKAFENKYRTQGFVEDVDFEHKFSGDYYEVEIEDQRGRDYEVRLDAQTGKVISVRRDY